MASPLIPSLEKNAETAAIFNFYGSPANLTSKQNIKNPQQNPLRWDLTRHHYSTFNVSNYKHFSLLLFILTWKKMRKSRQIFIAIASPPIPSLKKMRKLGQQFITMPSPPILSLKNAEIAAIIHYYGFLADTQFEKKMRTSRNLLLLWLLHWYPVWKKNAETAAIFNFYGSPANLRPPLHCLKYSEYSTLLQNVISDRFHFS